MSVKAAAMRWKKRIAALEVSDGISLDEKQKAAVAAAVRNGLMILTGGPGTGKTTTINTMIRYFEAEDMEIALAAPHRSGCQTDDRSYGIGGFHNSQAAGTVRGRGRSFRGRPL